MELRRKRVIISGGGTGGHIFPAISIANALRQIDHEIEILFIGASGRMEMEKVPASGYQIIGLPVAGFQRKISLRNLTFLFKLAASILKAKKILKTFKPDVVVGVGGYASGPILKAAQSKNIPTLIQEQNSYAGVTNKLLAKNALKICVAYDGMEKFFPVEKIIKTGNPVRADILNLDLKRENALKFFDLDPSHPVILVVGGSLGARTINESICQNLDQILRNKIQVLWQTGKHYHETARFELSKYNSRSVKVFEFIKNMDMAYKAANVVISRAGAGTISELCLVGKPCILVPSPNVAEDHQTKNALALANQGAALIVKDQDAIMTLASEAIALIHDDSRMKQLADKIEGLAMHNSDVKIANEILKLIKD